METEVDAEVEEEKEWRQSPKGGEGRLNQRRKTRRGLGGGISKGQESPGGPPPNESAVNS